MDYETRIAKVKAIMETNRQDIDRLYQAISELRKLILERTDHLQAELVAQRKYLDQRFDAQRKQFDDGFKEMRHKISINLRWTMGMALLNTSMILGIGGKLFGLY
jgi:hypothetical protein